MEWFFEAEVCWLLKFEFQECMKNFQGFWLVFRLGFRPLGLYTMLAIYRRDWKRKIKEKRLEIECANIFQ
jgi:hypothetical protein